MLFNLYNHYTVTFSKNNIQQQKTNVLEGHFKL